MLKITVYPVLYELTRIAVAVVRAFPQLRVGFDTEIGRSGVKTKLEFLAWRLSVLDAANAAGRAELVEAVVDTFSDSLTANPVHMDCFLELLDTDGIDPHRSWIDKLVRHFTETSVASEDGQLFLAKVRRETDLPQLDEK
jgi:hypothetical protein